MAWLENASHIPSSSIHIAESHLSIIFSYFLPSASRQNCLFSLSSTFPPQLEAETLIHQPIFSQTFQSQLLLNSFKLPLKLRFFSSHVLPSKPPASSLCYQMFSTFFFLCSPLILFVLLQGKFLIQMFTFLGSLYNFGALEVEKFQHTGAATTASDHETHVGNGKAGIPSDHPQG